jgi:O-antigen/teichoic acid export membrane protein
VVGLVTYAITVAGVFYLGYSSQVKIAVCIYAVTLFFSPIDVLALPYHAELRLHKLLAPSLAGTVLNAAFTVLVLALGATLPRLVAAALCALSVQYVWVAILVFRTHGGVPGRPAIAMWPALVREAWPLFAATVVSTVFQQAPVIALSLYSTEAVGLLAAAGKIPQQLIAIPMAIRGSTFPLLSQYWAEDREKFGRLLARIVKLSSLLASPLALFGTVLAVPASWLLIGAGQVGASGPFGFLMLTASVGFVSVGGGEALIAAGRQRLNLIILVVVLPFQLLLLMTLSGSFGALGAAGAIFASNTIVGIVVFAVLKWRMHVSTGIHPLPLLALAAAVGIGVFGPPEPANWTVFSGALAGAVLASAICGVYLVRMLWKQKAYFS